MLRYGVALLSSLVVMHHYNRPFFLVFAFKMTLLCVVHPVRPSSSMTASGILVQVVIQTQQHVSGMICGGSRRSCKLDSTTSDFGGTFGRPRPGLVNLVAPNASSLLYTLSF
jgi:hypothetical protein